MDITEELEQLLKDAKENGGMQYIFTLVRVDSYKSLPRDEVKAFFRYLQSIKTRFKKNDNRNLDKIFENIVSDYETYSLITNLIAVASGERFKFRPLPHTLDTSSFDLLTPDNGLHIDSLLEKLEQYKDINPKLHISFHNVFNEKVRAVYKAQENFTTAEEQKVALINIVNLLHSFLRRYFRELKNIGKGQKLHKAGHFEVYELHSNDEIGLYGFSVHQSNGTTATYKRYDDKSDGINYMLNQNGEVELQIGLWDTMQPIWMVGQQPLYEIGLQGRYNIIGEWKPLVYEGDSSLIQSRAMEMCKDEKDKRIVGCLFQIMATCYHTIEFIVKADFEIPHDYLSAQMGDLKIQLHKINMTPAPDTSLLNTCVYDGTAFLPKIDKETIGQVLDAIGIFLNRIAFRTDRTVTWFIKYDMYSSIEGKLRLDAKDFNVLGDYLLNLKSADVGVIDTAISWYTSGKNSKNIFTKFLNYYIAIESLSVLLVDGKLEASKDYGYGKVSKKDRKSLAEEKIKELHEELYSTDPILFIKRSYSEAITSLRSKTERGVKSILGEDDLLTADFLQKDDGKSMYDLRNDLAHGNYNYIDREEAHQIRNKLPLLEEVAYKFIMRLSSGKDVKHKRFTHFSAGISFGSPRGSLVTSNLSIFPINDWKIKWDWLD